MIAGGVLSDRQLRRFFIAVFFSVHGIWIQRVTMGWLAWEMTESAAFVGVVSGLSLAPALVIGPLFGVMADRIDIRRASFATNAGMAVVLAVLAFFLTQTGPLGLAVASAAIGVISAAHHPVRMSLGPRLATAEQVPHLVTLTALNFNIGRMTAPVLAGFVIATSGAELALWIAVACYAPMLSVLPGLHPRTLPPRPKAPILNDLWDGLRFAVSAPVVRAALLLTLIFATLVRGALEILPVLADGAFGRGAAGLGMLTAAAGIGAIAAASAKALGFAIVQHGIPTSALVAAMVGQGAVIAMGLAPAWGLALAATALAGFCATYVGVSMQAAIQSDLPDTFRGRVMSLWVVVGFGTVALGAFGIGGLGEVMGISAALAVAGIVGAVVQIWVILGVQRTL